jgi:hypothetical protein
LAEAIKNVDARPSAGNVLPLKMLTMADNPIVFAMAIQFQIDLSPSDSDLGQISLWLLEGQIILTRLIMFLDSHISSWRTDVRATKINEAMKWQQLGLL